MAVGTAGTPSPSSSSGAGEVGDGSSVGTGMSVGEAGSISSAETEAEAMAVGRYADRGGCGGGTATCSSLSPGSRGARDVGDGNSVGTGMSVGEDGAWAAPEEGFVEERASAVAGTAAALVGTGNSSSSSGAGDVGEG